MALSCEIVYMGTSPVHTGQLCSMVVAGCISKEDLKDFESKVDPNKFREWNGEKFWYEDGSMLTTTVG